MALQSGENDKVDKLLEREPNVTIFLRPIAAPAALGLEALLAQRGSPHHGWQVGGVGLTRRIFSFHSWPFGVVLDSL